MSAPRCAICHDSGSKNQTGDYLDCPACDMPHTRKALNDFVKSLGPTHPEDVALAIHQRALAMAPKQEAKEGSNKELRTLKEAAKRAGMANHFIDGKLRDDMFVIGKDFIERLHAELEKLCPPIAAPAAANGALTDERAAFDQWSKPIPYVLFSDYAWQAWQARATLAAAGQDAALVELIQKHWNGAYFQGVTKAEAREINEVLALSGAKGN